MQKHTNYFVGSDDGKSISFKEEKNAFIGPTCTIKFKHCQKVEPMSEAI